MKDQVWSAAKKTGPKFLGLESMTEMTHETPGESSFFVGPAFGGNGEMSLQVPCPVGSFGVEGQAALQLVSQAAQSLSSGRGVLVDRFVGRPKIRIPDTALGGGGGNECSVEIALSRKSPQTLNQGLSLALLWDMQRKWL